MGDSSLGVRVTGTKVCDGGFSRRGLEDGVQNEGHAYSKGLELAGSASVSETPSVVLHWVEYITWEQVERSSCSSLSFRRHAVEVWRERLVSFPPGWGKLRWSRIKEGALGI